jgi:peroxiredoxin
MRLKLYFTLILSFVFLMTDAQDKTPFTLKIKTNITNSYCFLANHFGSQKFKVDSIAIDAKGNGFYKDTKNAVKGGIYLLVFPANGNQYLEMILSGKEKNIELSFDSSSFSDVKFKNSEENDVFYADVKFLEPYQREASKLTTEYKSTTDAARKKELETLLKAKEKELVNRRLSIINGKPHLLYAKILNLMRDIDVPEPPKDANGKIDSSFKYYYFKHHYWDYTDFNDDRLLFTPIFENKFKYYFESLVIKHPDTLKKEVDYIIGKIKNNNSDMMRYCLATMLNDYANSKIMGQDALYVYIVLNYYAKGKAPWTDSASLKKMIADAEDLEPVLIGKTAQNFAVFDTTLVNYTRLYDMNTKPYKLLVFWSPDCGHCKKEIPVLDSLYPSFLKNDCDVFSVSTVADEGKGENIALWKKFIKDNKLRFKNYADPKYQMSPLFKVLFKIKGTPEYFLLDKDNKIIAKKLAPEQIIDFLTNYKKSLKN